MKKLFSVLFVTSIILTCCGLFACNNKKSAIEEDKPWYGTYYMNDKEYTIKQDLMFDNDGLEYIYCVKGNILYLGKEQKPCFHFKLDYNVLSAELKQNFYYGRITEKEGVTDSRVMITADEVLSLNLDGTYMLVNSKNTSSGHRGTYRLHKGILELKGRNIISNAPLETAYHLIINDGYGLEWYVGLKNPDEFFADATTSDSNTQQEGHTHNYTSVVNAPTCTEQGYTRYTCICGSSYVDNYVESLGHEFTNYVPNNDGTCINNGTKTAHCNHSGCNEIDTIEDLDSKVGHVYNNEWEKDDTYHWHKAICEHKNEISEKIIHNLDENDICIDCGYKLNYTKGLEYKIVDEHYIVRGIGSATEKEIILPSIYNGKIVTEIEYCAFDSCNEIEKVTLPITIETIGASAFENCTNLTSIEIGENVKRINEKSFYGCKKLTAISIPNSVKLIGSYAFSGCSSLTSVTIGDGVTSIGSYAFSGCSSLTSVTIGDSVKSIGEDAFIGCHELVRLNYNGSIDKWVMIEFPSYQGYYSNPLYYTNKLYLLNKKTKEYEEVKEINLSTATRINNYAFYNYTGLVSVDIGDSVKSIGKCAFNYCCNLRNVTIGDSVTSIGEYAFDYCYKLVEIINKSNLNIKKGSSHFGNVGNYALKVITDESQSNIIEKEDYIFYNDSGVYYLLEYKGSETELILPNNINGNDYEIYQYAFYKNDGIMSVVTGDSVTSVGQYAFCECSSLKSVVTGDSVTSVGQYAFFKCSSLKSVVIGNNVTRIEEWAFYQCKRLLNIRIPEKVNFIGNSAFCGCSKLIEVINKSSLDIKIGSNKNGDVGRYAKQIITNESQSNIIEQDDYIFYNDNGKYYLIEYKGIEKELFLPKNINGNDYSIYSNAFCTVLNIKSLVVPKGLIAVGEYLNDHVSFTLGNIYYEGKIEDWEKIEINNSLFKNATRYYYRETEPQESGNYWHYDIDGNIVEW